MTELRQLLRVVPGETRLAEIDPRSTPGLPGKRTTGADAKTWAREQVTAMGTELFTDQEMLFADAKVDEAAGRSVLLVLQAMDCGGKDGVIKRVAGAMNPLGLHIVSFGAPTAEERRHDFLWRIRKALPPRGNLGIFNRSHYEDVLVVRVNELAPESVWRPRYRKINDFERKLVADGTAMIKVMLHISYEEQGARLLERLNDPTSTGSTTRATWTRGPNGTTTRRHTPRRWSGAVPTRRRGSSSRPTASGTATGRWPTSSARRSPEWDSGTRRRRSTRRRKSAS